MRTGRFARRWGRLFLGALFVTVASWTLPAGPAAAETSAAPCSGEVIKIAWAAAAADYAPTWTALEEGFFRKNGVDISLVYLSPPASAQALAAGDVEILSSSGEGINLRAEGVDVKSFATVNHYLVPFGLFTRKGGPAAVTPGQLDGKSLAGTSPGSATDIYARYVLHRHHIDQRRIRFVFTQGLPAIYSGLSSSKFDVGALAVPFAYRAEADPEVGILVGVGREKVPGTTASLMAETEWIRSHEKPVESILRSIAAAVVWMRGHQEGTEQVMGKYLKLQDESLLQRMYDLYSRVWGIPNLEVDREGLQVALRYSPNPKAKGMKIDDLIYESNKLARAVE